MLHILISLLSQHKKWSFPLRIYLVFVQFACHYHWCLMTEFKVLSWQYLFKVNNGNTRTMCEICIKLTRKTPEWCHLDSNDVDQVKFGWVDCDCCYYDFSSKPLDVLLHFSCPAQLIGSSINCLVPFHYKLLFFDVLWGGYCGCYINPGC